MGQPAVYRNEDYLDENLLGGYSPKRSNVAVRINPDIITKEIDMIKGLFLEKEQTLVVGVEVF
ncbi:hypothetical protein Desmer_3356 [Desulfosporosinus meridiei DSM 13257]|uniref:Uncharacterized protein n=1 Tax=Desulfosporosinus meridiei (strain ATCC BAA-275 / DSM 13257 / KCTC 12902 / NCIMB 13706 / S10) TaxID=768704 RepID=J7ITM8_DESMD|nr:hypothetical protein Desmer_3356 [Desulfosporosinus meridiei DSM 13257]